MANDILNTNTMYTKKEVAKMLRVTVKTVERRVKLGLLKPSTSGRPVLFSPKDNTIIRKALGYESK